MQPHRHDHRQCVYMYVTRGQTALSCRSVNSITALNWRSIEGILAKSVVTSLTCTLQDTETSGLLFSIVAGIIATATKEGSFYTFGPIQSDKSDTESWAALPLATSTEKARSCCSAVPSGGLGQGVVYVAEHDGKDSANTCNFRGRDITAAFPMSSSPVRASCSVNVLEEDLYVCSKFLLFCQFLPTDDFLATQTSLSPLAMAYYFMTQVNLM